MIGECLERGTEFGIVWAADEGVRPVGCAMEITEVLERMDDGRMNILTRGTRPFRIVDERHDLAVSGRHGRVPRATSPRGPTPRPQTAAHEAYGAWSSRRPTARPDAERARRR